MAFKRIPKPTSVTHEGVTISNTLPGGMTLDEAARAARKVQPRHRAPVVIAPAQPRARVRPVNVTGDPMRDEFGAIPDYIPNPKMVANHLALLRKDKQVRANYRMVFKSFGQIRNREMQEAWRLYQQEEANAHGL